MTDYHLEEASDGNAEAWEAFNRHSRGGSIFHRLSWKAVAEKASSTAWRYYLLYRDGEVCGLFPFVEHEIGFFFGLIAPTDPQRLPIVLEDPPDPLALAYLLKELRTSSSGKKKASFVCLSTFDPALLRTIADHPVLPWTDEGEMVLDLRDRPPKTIWSSLSSGKRKMIRRSEKDGLTVREAHSLDGLREFYRNYAANMRSLGGRLLPFDRFADEWNASSGDMRITLASLGPVNAGGMITHLDPPRRSAYTTYLSLNRDLSNRYTPSYSLWWETIAWASDNGIDRVHFGAQRPDEANPRYHVKQNLGARYTPIFSGMVPLSAPYHLCISVARSLPWLKPGQEASTSQTG